MQILATSIAVSLTLTVALVTLLPSTIDANSVISNSVQSGDTKDEGTTPAPNVNCSQQSGCDDCVKSLSCYYCNKDKKCYEYQKFHPFQECSISDSYYKTCKIKANVLAIVLGSLLGLLGLIILVGLLYCCVIKPCIRRCYEKDESRWQRDRLVLEQVQRERRRERNGNLDAIRAKYGIQPRGGANDDRF